MKGGACLWLLKVLHVLVSSVDLVNNSLSLGMAEYWMLMSMAGQILDADGCGGTDIGC